MPGRSVGAARRIRRLSRSIAAGDSALAAAAFCFGRGSLSIRRFKRVGHVPVGVVESSQMPVDRRGLLYAAALLQLAPEGVQIA